MYRSIWYAGRLLRQSSGSAVAFLLVATGSLSLLISPVRADSPQSPNPVPEGSAAPASPPSPSPGNHMMTPESVQLDPLDSPHPVPWNWVMATLAEGNSTSRPRLRYYRSQSLISPDGVYAAYSRIQIQLSSDFTQNRVASVLFLENLRTGELQTITASSPFSDNPFTSEIEPHQGGTIAILIPVAWSASGDRVLAREFEAIFGSDIASDFAVVWDRETKKAHTLAPTHVQYTNAVLLGWSQSHPDRVLFRAGNLGDPEWGLWAVDASGETKYAAEDRPVTFGQLTNNVWAGPQAYLRSPGR